MEKISTIELSQVLGGAWSKCEETVMLGNTGNKDWTEEMWKNWIKDYEENCL